jgi:glycosyltransferase involved in cell wall biosynthesis
MGDRVTRAGLDSLRVAVVSSRLWPGFNDIWDAVEPQVGSLVVVGARSAKDAGPDEPQRVALRGVDLGRGLVWQHLVGLRRFLRSFSPDVIHVNRELWAVLAQEVVGSDAAVVVHGAENLWHHGGTAEQAVRRRLVDRAVRRIAGYASWNHAGADHVVRRRQELGLDPVPSLVLPAVVPPAPFRDVDWEPALRPELEVLLVGRAVPAKGFADVIEAAAGIPALRITLCGAGDGLGALARLAAARDVRLETPGQLKPPELARVMAHSDLLVQPSRTTDDWAEQFGRTVAEAMTVGLPCLVSDSGELPHLVAHDPRAIFRERDVTDLREHLAELRDPAALRGLADRQRGPAAAWEPARAGAAVLDLWQRALS